MMKLTAKSIEDNGLLIYKYYRGSTAHGLRTDTSDYDIGGVFICPTNILFGLGDDYVGEVSDDNNNLVYFEIGKYMKLLAKSNPNVLESLFVDDEFVIYEHPLMTKIKSMRESFVTKECFDPYIGYGKSQIHKARGYNKMVHYDDNDVQRKEPIDFCYTFYNQGSTKLENWLAYRGLKQEYCGAVNVNNMPNMYSIFYDFGQHAEKEGYSVSDAVNYYELVTSPLDMSLDEIDRQYRDDKKYCFGRFVYEKYDNYIDYSTDDIRKVEYDKVVGEVKNLRGLFAEGSTQIRLSSIPNKDENPITFISFNEDAYSNHCRRYRDYQTWLKNRNEERYKTNKDKSYDAKNMAACFRMIKMGIEIANGEGVKVRRTEDRDFLLDVKHHKYSYDELIEMLEEMNDMMSEVMEASQIPETVDVEAINDLLIDIRHEFNDK